MFTNSDCQKQFNPDVIKGHFGFIQLFLTISSDRMIRLDCSHLGTELDISVCHMLSCKSDQHSSSAASALKAANRLNRRGPRTDP